MKKKIINLVIALVIVLFVNLMGESPETENSYNDVSNFKEGSNLEVHFIDVGQADSILIKSGTESMLIDAGNNADGDLVVNYLKEQEISDLKFVIGTHPHEDHIGGLDDVIDNFNIATIIMPNVMHTTKTFEDVLDSINNKGLKINSPKVGTTYDLNGASVLILAPNSEEYKELNNYSVVVKLTHGENSFLFTGDAEALSENEMMENNIGVLDSDILKIGHHGSITSTSGEFLDAVNPKYAIISLGKDNDYGHPHKEIIELLEENEIEILRTDKMGTIVATSDGTILDLYTVR
ncbi:MBL fold metallo-hydrolase [Tissierella sp. Yu-01]|uniref:ComEC/Rec2 family competence protein n=1 Tax=Tissierella sp. Yu-01 TaxID=3035694 RepID=UPI00240E0549|nr:MBL fold metallo-hydrolase [Tissierella sp. Yu-01]WFA08863.1 MBL fold metallo-hydrolase [Tissierella sp. Yu-01]